ncbi:ester cyclase [Mycobacterium sp.]|uniref:ester cyclase n=1 Tax=Mycobacterium sp. TaxID=1785 RepID=UPI003F9EB9F3
MGAADNAQVHRNWIAAEDKRDLSNLEEFLHPDFELHPAGIEPVFGIHAYRAFRSTYFEGVPDEQVVVEDLFATDDRTVCRWRIRGTQTGTLFGLPPTGRAIDYSGISIYEVTDGKLRRGWIEQDSMGLMGQLTS